MAISWPNTLPRIYEADGYSEELPDVTLRTQMDDGPAKVRRRSTAGVSRMKLTMRLTPAQRTTFINYFMNDLKGGAESFYFYRLGDDTQSICRILPKPQLSLYGTQPFLFKLELNVEVLP